MTGSAIWSDEKRKDILDYYVKNPKARNSDIAILFGISKAGLRKAAMKAGIYRRNRMSPINWEMIDPFLYDLDVSHTEISRRFDILPATVLSRRRKLGIKVRARMSKSVIAPIAGQVGKIMAKWPRSKQLAEYIGEISHERHTRAD